MVEFKHICKHTGNTYRSRIPLAVSYEMRHYSPEGENMYIWLDAQGRYVGGGTLESEMIQFKFSEEGE